MKVSSSGPPTSVIRLALAASWFLLVGSPVSVAPAVLLVSQLLGAALSGMVGKVMVDLPQATTKPPDGRRDGVRQQSDGAGSPPGRSASSRSYRNRTTTGSGKGESD